MRNQIQREQFSSIAMRQIFHVCTLLPQRKQALQVSDLLAVGLESILCAALTLRHSALCWSHTLTIYSLLLAS